MKDMFYENERIINKQLKFVKIRAYGIIQDLETKGLSDKEIVACLGLLMKDSTEYGKDILDYALKTVNARQEQSDAVQAIDTSYTFTDGRIQCKVPAIKPNTREKALPNSKNRKPKS
jgi:hypothetical protein